MIKDTKTLFFFLGNSQASRHRRQSVIITVFIQQRVHSLWSSRELACFLEAASASFIFPPVTQNTHNITKGK